MTASRTVIAELTADEINWTLDPVPWSDSTQLLDAAADLLILKIADDEIADLMEQLALLVIERDERIKGMRELESVALEQLHVARREIDRLHGRLIEARSELRQRRAA